jgi:hypothetical protein
VRFRWKDYAHHKKRRTMTLSNEEFLRRFLQHILPRGFPLIRYFGWRANFPLPLSFRQLLPEHVPIEISRMQPSGSMVYFKGVQFVTALSWNYIEGYDPSNQ